MKVDKDVMGEVEGMVKIPQIPRDFRQNEVRDELIDEKTTENPQEIEEKKRTRRRMFRRMEEGGKSGRIVQIFVKVHGARTGMMEMALSDKVNDIVKRIPTSACCNKCNVYVTCEGKVLRRNEELRSCGVRDGCIVQVVNRMRGGGKHRNKKNIAKKNTAASPKGQEPQRGQQEHGEEKISQSLLRREIAEDAVIRHFEETEGSRKIIANLAEGNNSDWKGGYNSIRR